MSQTRNNQYFCLVTGQEFVTVFFFYQRMLIHTKHSSVADAMLWMKAAEAKTQKNHIMLSFAPINSTQYTRIIAEMREFRKTPEGTGTIVKFPTETELRKFRFFVYFKKAVSQYFLDRKEVKKEEVTNKVNHPDAFGLTSTVKCGHCGAPSQDALCETCDRHFVEWGTATRGEKSWLTRQLNQRRAKYNHTN